MVKEWRKTDPAAAPLALVDATAQPTQRQPTAAPQTRFLTVAEGRIAFDDTGGSGPVILAIPGMGDLRSEYRLLRPVLTAAGYRVVTMDVRGFGETSARWGDFSAHAVGRDALALLEHLDAGPAVVLGNSFAAGSALWAAHDAPAKVRGVALLGPIVRDGEWSWFGRIALDLGFGGPWRVWFWTTYWNSLFPTRKPADQTEIKRAIALNLQEPDRMAALRAMIGLSKADTEAMLPNSRVPALVVMGTLDPDFPDARAEAGWLSEVLGSKCVLIDGAGHYPHTEMPEQVAPALISFIEDLNPRAHRHGDDAA
jgi:pimeloyl-ACP methyl ester carboxylesterase